MWLLFGRAQTTAGARQHLDPLVLFYQIACQERDETESAKIRRKSNVEVRLPRVVVAGLAIALHVRHYVQPRYAACLFTYLAAYLPAQKHLLALAHFSRAITVAHSLLPSDSCCTKLILTSCCRLHIAVTDSSGNLHQKSKKGQIKKEREGQVPGLEPVNLGNVRQPKPNRVYSYKTDVPKVLRQWKI